MLEYCIITKIFLSNVEVASIESVEQCHVWIELSALRPDSPLLQHLPDLLVNLSQVSSLVIRNSKHHRVSKLSQTSHLDLPILRFEHSWILLNHFTNQFLQSL